MKFMYALLMTFLLTYPLHAQTTLHIGDAPPPFKTVEWIKGSPVTDFEEGHTYLVMFCATWCPPCEAAIPHMNELQQRFRERKVHVVGLAAREHGETVDDKRIELTNFLSRNHGVPIEYTMGFDGSGVVAREWMDAAAISGVPSLFVVNAQGQLVYIGHPMNLTDDIMERILDSTWDPSDMESTIAYNASSVITGQGYNKRFSEAVQAKDWKTALKVAREATQDVNVEHPEGWFFKIFGLYNNIDGWPATLRRMNGDITYRWESYNYLRLILMWLGNAYDEVPNFAQTASKVPERLIYRLEQLILQGRTEGYGGFVSDVYRLSADIFHAVEKPELAQVYEEKFNFSEQIEDALRLTPTSVALSAIGNVVVSRHLSKEQRHLVAFNLNEYTADVGDMSAVDRSLAAHLLESLQAAPHACVNFVN